MEYQFLLKSDDSIHLDLLNQLCLEINDHNGRQQELLTILNQFVEKPDSYQYCVPILTDPKYHPHAKFMVSIILKRHIIQTWAQKTEEEKQAMKEFIIQTMYSMIKEGQKEYDLSILNQCLVEILKFEWPGEWPDFCKEIILRCQEEDILYAINTLDIFKQLADEISLAILNSDLQKPSPPNIYSNEITVDRLRLMQSTFLSEFPVIFRLLSYCFGITIADPTVMQDLHDRILKAIISFIPVVGGETLLTDSLVSFTSPLLHNSRFTFQVFSVFGKICESLDRSKQTASEGFATAVPAIFSSCIEKIASMFGRQLNFSLITKPQAHQLILNVHSFLKVFHPLIDSIFNGQLITHVLHWLIQIMSTRFIDETDDQIFPDIVQFWRDEFAYMVKLVKGDSPPEDPQIVLALYSEALSVATTYLARSSVSPYTTMIDDDYITINTSSYESNLYTVYKEALLLATNFKKDELMQSINYNIETIQTGKFNLGNINQCSWVVGAVANVLTPEENQILINSIVPVYMGLINAKTEHGEELQKTTVSALFFLCSRVKGFFYYNLPAFVSLIEQITLCLVADSPLLNVVSVDTLSTLSNTCKQQFLQPLENGTNVLDCLLDQFLDILSKMNTEYIPDFVSSISSLLIFYESIQNPAPLVDKFYALLKSLVSTLPEVDPNMKLTRYISGILEQSGSSDLVNLIDLTYPIALDPIELPFDENMLNQIKTVLQVLNAVPVSRTKSYIKFINSILLSLVYIYEIFTTFANTLVENGKIPQDILIEISNLVCQVLGNTVKMSFSCDSDFPVLLVSSMIGSIFSELSPIAFPPELLNMYSGMLSIQSSSETVNAIIQKVFVQSLPSIFLPLVRNIREDDNSFYDLRLSMLDYLKHVFIFQVRMLIGFADLPSIFEILYMFARSQYFEIGERGLRCYYYLITSLDELQKKFPPLAPKVSEFWTAFGLKFAMDMFQLLQNPDNKYGFDAQVLVLSNLLRLTQVREQWTDLVSQVATLFPKAIERGFDIAEFMGNLGAMSGDLINFRSAIRDFLILVMDYSPKDPSLCMLEVLHQKRQEELEIRGVANLDNKETEVEVDIEQLDEIFSNLYF